MMNELLHWARLALAFLWIFTGLTSSLFAPTIGYQLLAEAGINDQMADLLVYGGSLVDIILGIWLLIGKGLRACCHIQIIIIVTYTVLLTLISPVFWLHPFGPLTKNIPILVLIVMLYKASDK